MRPPSAAGARRDAEPAVRGSVVDKLDAGMRAICAKLDVPRATPHDLRRTFSRRVTALGAWAIMFVWIIFVAVIIRIFNLQTYKTRF